MSEPATLDEILKELKKNRKHSRWPVHIVGQAAMIASPAGRLLQLSTEVKYDPSQIEQNDRLLMMKQNAVLCAAACIRFLENLKK